MGFMRVLVLLAGPLLLASCLLTPGKFTSTLDIKRDRSFSFAYQGEVVVAENQNADARCDPESETPCDPAAQAKKRAEDEAKLREIADALSKEEGYRSVQYLGNRKYRVDYAVTGRLDRNFIFPFNSDAVAIFPWIAVELRKDGTARMKAPGFGEDSTIKIMGSSEAMGPSQQQHEGTFTLTTDAEIVMQNEESGVQAGAGGAKRIVWRITPSTKTEPTAVLRF